MVPIYAIDSIGVAAAIDSIGAVAAIDTLSSDVPVYRRGLIEMQRHSTNWSAMGGCPCSIRSEMLGLLGIYCCRLG
jgi:hypothetical protein